MYKLVYCNINNQTNFVIRLSDNAQFSLNALDNTDYANFKIDLTNGAELQDANSNVMTANQISAFLATLP